MEAPARTLRAPVLGSAESIEYLKAGPPYGRETYGKVGGIAWLMVGLFAPARPRCINGGSEFVLYPSRFSRRDFDRTPLSPSSSRKKCQLHTGNSHPHSLEP